MCVINLEKPVKGPIAAWKIFERNHGRLYGVRGFRYKINKLHIFGEPGSQAFVNRDDAFAAQERHWPNHIVRQVILYSASKGTINQMDPYSNGRLGWTARKIRVPFSRPRKKKA